MLLPQANILLPTYRQRVEKLCHVYPNLPFAPLFGPEFPAFLQMCLARRLDLDIQDVDMADLYIQTMYYLELALACVSPAQQPDLKYRTGFNEHPVSPRQWLTLIRLGQGISRRKGVTAMLEWLRMPKKEKLSQGLFAMHHALLAWKKGDVSEAGSQLSQSNSLLEQLTGLAPSVPSADFPARWQITRIGWGRFWGRFIRLGDTEHSSRYEKIMEWQHE